MNEVWKLTDREIAECDWRGVSVVALQEAKKKAYIASGGVILNPDALEDLYRALQALAVIVECGEHHKGEELNNAFKALAKAEK